MPKEKTSLLNSLSLSGERGYKCKNKAPVIVSKEELLEREDFFIGEMKAGKIFIYPTDTIYGIGCDSRNQNKVEEIKKIKNRENKLFSVIAPSFEWIKSNCIIDEGKLSRIKKLLPGPYTIILPQKSTGTLGVRIPKHYFCDIIKKLGISFITTSVNLSGEPSVINFSEIPEKIYKSVDYIISDDLSLSGKGSTIIDMTGEKEIIIRK